MPDDDDLFAYFRNITVVCTDGTLCVDWRVTEWVWLRLLLTAGRAMECVLGRTPGNPAPEDQGAVFARVRGSRAEFRAVLEVHNGWPRGAGLEAFQ